MLILDMSKGWSVTQDVHDAGEAVELFMPDFDTLTVNGHLLGEWQPIDHLGHLQPLLSNTPYFGRELRYFNQAPWWYKLSFEVPKGETGKYSALRFEGVDYFCKVWLNGGFLGGHEGYSSPFEFEAGHLLKLNGPNVLIVRVCSPWDGITQYGGKKRDAFNVVRDMLKGTYEHADTFVQRDVNPIGIWNGVKLFFHSGVRFLGRPQIQTRLSDDFKSADIKLDAVVSNLCEAGEVTLCCTIREKETGIAAAYGEWIKKMETGETKVDFALAIDNPQLWTIWERGEQNLYTAEICIKSRGGMYSVRECFGIRDIKLHRAENEMVYYLNGSKIFLRGTTYFPDVYISKMHYSRYLRDLKAIRDSGCNAVRIHVHVEKPEFYDLCDEMGILIIQDSDLNWVHPMDEVFKNRAVKVFGDMLCELRNHPSIITWICMNEPMEYSKGYMLTTCPGPQLMEEAKRLDPDRPAIKGSGAGDDPDSGDTHNYLGSLCGEATHYTGIFGQRTERINTEFGFDAPPCVESLRLVPQMYSRLKSIADGIGGIQYYQYRLLKYYIENYRIAKYSPCSGYFQFMFIDLCPQSFYGVYDWRGIPKGGLQALEESNKPVGVFMEYKENPVAIWAVNDMLKSFPGCRAQWVVTDGKGVKLHEGETILDVTPDSIVKVSDLAFPVDMSVEYTVILTLRSKNGELLAKNTYKDPFHHPEHPKQHPQRIQNDLGMRLFHA